MKKKRSRWGFRIFLIVLFLVAIYLSMTTTTSIVRGSSMLDTFQDGDRVLVNNAYWLIGPINRDDVVVVRRGEDEYAIKRVKYLPGDEVPLMYFPQNVRIDSAPYHVPEGMVYVMGDNREVSEDSRMYGPVRQEDIVGKVVQVRPL
ncbi:MAG: signal peptidase I [Fimbriimonadaceae bacterium]